MSLPRAQSSPPQERTEAVYSALGRVVCRPAFAGLLLVVVTLAVFGPATAFDFINCDDPDYFAANPHVKGGLTKAGVVWAFSAGHAANWHPLTWLSLMLDASVLGPGAWGPHLTNVLLHAANTGCLFLLLRRLTGAPWRSAVVAGLFGLHPLRVESVAWVAERKDVLSAFFFMLTLLAYAQYVQGKKSKLRSRSGQTDISRAGTQPATHNPSHPSLWYLLALLWFVLGLLSKPMLVTLPFVLLLLDYWPLRRVQLSIVRRQPSTLLPLLREKLPFFLLSAGSCLVTYFVQQEGKAVADFRHLPAAVRLENALVSCARYLGKLLWPADLAILYPYPGEWRWAVVVFAGFLTIGLCWAALAVGLRRRYVLAGWYWFLGMLIPVLGLVQVGLQSMADRYTYLPSIGLFIVLVWGTSEVFWRWRLAQSTVAFLALALLAACVLRTSGQLRWWEGTEPLFRHALAVTERNTFAHNNLGCYLRLKGRYAEAIEQFEAALKIEPQNADVLNNYGYLFAEKKQYDKAIKYYQEALLAKPEHLPARENLAEAFSKSDKFNEAREAYLALLRLKPKQPELHNRLGVALAAMGRFDEAKPQFQEALRLRPEFAAAHCNLGNALAAQHKFDEAILHFREALLLNPDYPEAQNNLGSALEDKGNLLAALPCYREALRLNPNYAQAHFNLGSVLSQLGRRTEAVAHLKKAVQLKPDYAKAQQKLRELEAALPP